MLHPGAAGDEEQLVGTEANKGPNGQLSIRLHQRAPRTDIPRECRHGADFISILPQQDDPAPEGDTLMCTKL